MKHLSWLLRFSHAARALRPSVHLTPAHCKWLKKNQSAAWSLAYCLLARAAKQPWEGWWPGRTVEVTERHLELIANTTAKTATWFSPATPQPSVTNLVFLAAYFASFWGLTSAFAASKACTAVGGHPLAHQARNVPACRYCDVRHSDTYTS